jgi:hypothetical protein
MECVKCGHISETSKKKGTYSFCEICSIFAPNEKLALKEYSEEKIPKETIETFRKNFRPGEKQKIGMMKKAVKGNLMSRSPFGYKIENKKLVPAQNSKEIEEIFEEFLTGDFSLRQLAEKHNLSVNGLKKVLRNFTYIGKIKFNNEVYDGDHSPLISTTLFNHVQNKLEKLGIK